MRLIDGDMLIRKCIDTDIEKFSNSDVKIVLENLKQNILKAPSIEIVRCKECRCWIDDRKSEDDMGTCGLTHFFTNPDDFCSYGEREGE